MEPTFSDSSYGFRPGRSAHDALHAAAGYVEAGRPIVVDVDLEQFFDRVNHDVLMARLARRIGDKRLLRIIRRFVQAGIMADGGVCVATKARLRVVRSRPCWPTFCWTTCTKSWNAADAAFAATPTTAPFT